MLKASTYLLSPELFSSSFCATCTLHSNQEPHFRVLCRNLLLRFLGCLLPWTLLQSVSFKSRLYTYFSRKPLITDLNYSHLKQTLLELTCINSDLPINLLILIYSTPNMLFCCFTCYMLTSQGTFNLLKIRYHVLQSLFLGFLVCLFILVLGFFLVLCSTHLPSLQNNTF